MIAAPTRPVLRYHGGKWIIAPWIIDHFPQHRAYVEPFCGAGSVLLRKPRAFAEVINDLDGEIINLFRVLRSPRSAGALRRRIVFTAFSRQEFVESYEPTDDPVERARRLIVRAFMGHGSEGTYGRKTGFRANGKSPQTSVAMEWRRWPDEVPSYVDRLRGVTIEQRPALQVIAEQDAHDTLFYVDPPYPHGTRQRAREHSYNFEMTDEDHRHLAAALRSAKAHVVVSGYACDLYDRDLFADWHRVQRAANADGGLARTEVLWLSPRTAAALSGRQQHMFDPTERT